MRRVLTIIVQYTSVIQQSAARLPCNYVILNDGWMIDPTLGKGMYIVIHRYHVSNIIMEPAYYERGEAQQLPSHASYWTRSARMD